MVLSNAERQRRYLARLKEKAQGVTPDDIHRARRIMWESFRGGTWEGFVATCRKPKNREYWREMLPEGGDIADYDEFEPADAELLTKVGALIEAINKVPKED